MSWTLVLVVVVTLFIVVGLKVLAASRPARASSYRKLKALLTPAERSFFGVLQSTIHGRLQVFAKVRVADVIAPEKGLVRGDWQSAFNRIAAKHFDFVLCKPDDLSVVCVLELDDNSHATKKRIQRDELLQNACDFAKLPLVRFKAKSAYTRGDIEHALLVYLPDSIKPSLADLPPDVDATTKTELPSEDPGPETGQCPKCGCDPDFV